ncbi:hypothetical protein [Arcobacter porcinus]|uniref:hypothetical protein n=1 Tax=Arcobacter porcinus TaxID=1935204 RepID=UPI0008250813|nr:hypothetical protein [Arcobacter porcinus]OCL88266.1 hypothetical protein AAX30_00882 [Arcobacter porcinus]
MPQLIAMIIIVVGAMIYMFQTFGGTGDKITGVAQKTSIITEINNIKSGLQFAARDKVIYGSTEGDDKTDVDEPKVKSLQALAELNYFAEQINEQLTTNKAGAKRAIAAGFNRYGAISFGGNSGNAEDEDSDMILSLVVEKDMIPGIFVDLSKGGLKDNAPFLENQISNDLKGIAFIDRKANSAKASSTKQEAGANATGVKTRLPIESTDGKNDDGMFTVYFTDFGASEVVK